MEQTHALLNTIIITHIRSETGLDLPPNVLNHIGTFTKSWFLSNVDSSILTKHLRTLQKIHTFVEGQQNGSRVKKFFRHGEMSKLLRDCKTGLQQELMFFRVGGLINIVMVQKQIYLARSRPLIS